MMLRRIYIIRTTVNHHRRRRHISNSSLKRFFSSSPSTTGNAGTPPRIPITHRLRRNSVTRAAVATSLISAAACYTVFSDEDEFHGFTIERSNESLKRVLETVKHTGVAVTVLWKSLSSVLSSANYEVRLGFEVRVAALLADIVAADDSRRAAIIGAGGGLVVDWLLDSVSLNRGGSFGTQAESARALAYLIADCNVSESVLRRPKAVPNLLRFILSAHPEQVYFIFPFSKY